MQRVLSLDTDSGDFVTEEAVKVIERNSGKCVDLKTNGIELDECCYGS